MPKKACKTRLVEEIQSWSFPNNSSHVHDAVSQQACWNPISQNLYGEPVVSKIPKEVPGSSDWAFTDGIIQPSVVSLGGERLRLYARSTARMGKVCVADSSDAGKTWTQARPINLPNPNSGLDAVTLKDGRIVLAYNHTNSGRSPLNLAISVNAEDFTMFKVLEDEPGEFSYPAIVQGKSGSLYITYTWNRKRICYVQVQSAEIPL
jgi:predicted neuraminidase